MAVYNIIEVSLMAKNIHDGHRQRVRKAFLDYGFNEKTPPHKVLEMLLFYSIPRRDTNEVAHELLNRFGSVAGILDAPQSELLKVDGVGENTVALLKLILPMARLYGEDKGKSRFDDMDQIFRFLKNKYLGYTNEMFSILSFDNRGVLIGFDFLTAGDVASVGISTRMVIEAVLKHNAAGVIMAHNHPGGNALPSKDDIKNTELLANALRSINVHLLDHVILCSDDYVSLAQSHQYSHIFK